MSEIRKTPVKMDIKVFNELNTLITEMIERLKPFDNSSISTARKSLMEAGKSISENYYRYTPDIDKEEEK